MTEQEQPELDAQAKHELEFLDMRRNPDWQKYADRSFRHGLNGQLTEQEQHLVTTVEEHVVFEQ